MSRTLGKRDDGAWIDVSGFVTRLIADDDEGARHQRFIIDVGDRQTLLIAHNVDVAKRVPVGMGDRVQVRGVYEWNDLGGLVHWTHNDPLGIDDGGWVRFRGIDYR